MLFVYYSKAKLITFSFMNRYLKKVSSVDISVYILILLILNYIYEYVLKHYPLFPLFT